MSITIAGKTFNSRLMLGTGKFNDFEVMKQAQIASGEDWQERGRARGEDGGMVLG